MFQISLLVAIVTASNFLEVLRDTCGGNCPSNNCNRCFCPAPQYYDIAYACSRFTGWSQSCCQCVIQHESAGNQHAEQHNTDGSDDVGLWQINSINWATCGANGQPPCDVNTNLECAKAIWAWGGNCWRLWSTCGVCGCCNSP